MHFHAMKLISIAALLLMIHSWNSAPIYHVEMALAIAVGAALVLLQALSGEKVLVGCRLPAKGISFGKGPKALQAQADFDL
jgi:hypothetical protein